MTKKKQKSILETQATFYVSVDANDATEALVEFNKENETHISWERFCEFAESDDNLYSYIFDQGISDYSVNEDEYTEWCLEMIVWEGAA